MFSTTLTADRAILCKALDPLTDPIVIGTVFTNDPELALAGEFRNFAGDRTQLVTYASSNKTLTLSFVSVSRAEQARIEAWCGDFLLLRTTDGLRLFGGYLAVASKRLLNVDADDGSNVTHTCTVAFQQVSYDESV